MSLKLNERYPGRFNNPSADYPQGSFKNRTTPTAKDGSYLEKDWANDKEGFFQSLLEASGIVPNGMVDKVGGSQLYDAIVEIISTITLLKLNDASQSSETDDAVGKLMRVKAFGLGSSVGGPNVLLAEAFRNGFYKYSASDPSAPGGGGSPGSLIVNSSGGNLFHHLAITVPTTTDDPLISFRAFDESGVPGPWLKLLHSGSGSLDPWAMQPIGSLIAVRDDLVGASIPSTASSYRYIKLTASDSYNSGVLTSESVTGSYPLVIATAAISFPGSPMTGQSVNLVNTERRFLRAGLSGAVEQDTMQGHLHGENVGPPGTGGNTSDTLASFASGLSAAGAYQLRLLAASATKNVSTISGAISDPTFGDVRVSSETRPKTLGVTYYMRIK